MMNRATKVLFTCMAATAVLACGGGDSKPAETPPAPAPTPAASATASTMETPSQAATSGSIQIAQEILTACSIPSTDSFFAFDSSRLEKKDLTGLNAVAVCFTTGPLKGRTMKLVGYADPRGASGYNMTLGQARADAVQKYLTDKGTDPSKTPSTSRGAMDATGTDEAGWAHDRRVDIMLGS